MYRYVRSCLVQDHFDLVLTLRNPNYLPRYARTIRGYFFYLDKPNSPLNMLNLLDAIAIFASVFMDQVMGCRCMCGLKAPLRSTLTSSNISCVVIQEYFVNSNDSAGLSFVSLFRVIRMVRVLRSLKRFQVIFRTLKHLLPALARYVLLVFLIFYVFAVIGMELFGNLLINNENSTTYLYVSQSSYVIEDFTCGIGVAKSLITLVVNVTGLGRTSSGVKTSTHSGMPFWCSSPKWS